MNDEILIIKIDKQTKEALKNRAFDLRLSGGMSEHVKNLIAKDLEAAAQPVAQPAPAAAEQQ